MSGDSGASSSEDDFYDNKEKDLFSTPGEKETRVSEKMGVCVCMRAYVCGCVHVFMLMP